MSMENARLELHRELLHEEDFNRTCSGSACTTGARILSIAVSAPVCQPMNKEETGRCMNEAPVADSFSFHIVKCGSFSLLPDSGCSEQEQCMLGNQYALLLVVASRSGREQGGSMPHM